MTDAAPFAYGQLSGAEQKALVLDLLKQFEAKHLEYAVNIAAYEQRPDAAATVIRLQAEQAKTERSIAAVREKYAALLAPAAEPS